MKALYPADYVTKEEAARLEKARRSGKPVTVTHGDGVVTKATIETSGLGLAGKVFFTGPGSDAPSLTFADSGIEAITADGDRIYQRHSTAPLEATVLELQVTAVAYHEAESDPAEVKKDVEEQLLCSLDEGPAFADQSGPSALALAEVAEGSHSEVLFEPRAVSIEKAQTVRKKAGESEV